MRTVRILTIALIASLLSGDLEGLRAADERPNILFAISDDQSYPHTSAYRYKAISTPAFDRVAREGILFTNAIAPSPGCSPSRAAMLTGRYPWQLEHAGTHGSSFSAKYVTYPEILEKAGYFIGYTRKGWGPGNFKDGGRNRNPAGPSFSRRSMEAPNGVAQNDYAANFKDFLAERPQGTPFWFWFGASEPHRKFAKGIGRSSGMKREEVVVPPFLPDVPEVRDDVLDYCFEIQWFDRHLSRMIDALEKAGELENTVIVVTSDNGMSFPRAKANLYEYGIHMPLAVSWPRKVPKARVVDDLVSLIDFAPTFLELAGADHPSGKSGKFPMSRRSLVSLLLSEKGGRVDPSRTAVYSARERHSSSRWNNLAYPQRCIRTKRHLLVRNFKPERWPAGAPQKYAVGSYPKNTDKLGPMHGAYHDIDACPTLDYLVENRGRPAIGRFLELAVGRRPALELFDIEKDPGCLNDLTDDPAASEVKKSLSQRLDQYLRATGDPRVLGNGDIFETYKRYAKLRKFPQPDWARGK